ncbi:hypothetical protein ACFOY8_12985 [Thalassospira xianhensis]|uniref:Uncharacterized protein n=2 Tax=Thalassospira TaxID=168934 RepID=A0A285TXH7_9PROT|nr:MULTISPECIES: hypothetical protein [Thalassospira]RCK07864.1 hypothetical protein TH5_02305 [Thalassospira xianhensis MCCC 1A02616]SOC27277.1 hypothetical protein SAMN05428964_105349 [Thalassospira xiamenensis]
MLALLKNIACAATVFLAVAIPPAQGFATPTTEVTFWPDTNQYGLALLEQNSKYLLERYEQQGIPVTIKVAQIDLDDNGQPEFAVRTESSLCDRYGCDTKVFMLIGTTWKPILQTRTSRLLMGGKDRTSGMALLQTDGNSWWAWDGQRYDIVY